MKIKTTNWTYFKFSELFDIKKGKRLTKADMIPGNIPFVGSSDANNGWTAKIAQEALHDGNTISVSYNGSVAEAFYQPIPYCATDDVNVLYPKFKLDTYTALFLITIIRKEKYRFNYGRKWHVERMNSSRIKLPATSNGELDTKYMINLIKSIKLLNKIDLNNINQLTVPFKNETKLSLDTITWKWFKYSDLFIIERGRGPRIKNLDGDGHTPFVTSIESNNGWTGFTSMEPVHKGNTLGVNRNGSVAESFYQPIPFCSTEDVHVFNPKFRMNKYIGLFFVTLIRRERYRFSYGRKWGISRMNSTKIKLPVTKDGQPDYEFMEEYIKRLPLSSQI